MARRDEILYYSRAVLRNTFLFLRFLFFGDEVNVPEMEIKGRPVHVCMCTRTRQARDVVSLKARETSLETKLQNGNELNRRNSNARSIRYGPAKFSKSRHRPTGFRRTVAVNHNKTSARKPIRFPAIVCKRTSPSLPSLFVTRRSAKFALRAIITTRGRRSSACRRALARFRKRRRRRRLRRIGRSSEMRYS